MFPECVDLIIERELARNEVNVDERLPKIILALIVPIRLEEVEIRNMPT